MCYPIFYEVKEKVEEILNRQDKYVTFEISECTEKALDKKCDFILECQKRDWKPLKLDFKEHIRILTKTFYMEKY